MSFKYLLVAWTVTVINGQGFGPAGFITTECLDCLREASSGNNLDIGCNNYGPGSYHCGPYQISYSYWYDAGSPGSNPEDPLDFEKCLNDRTCAEGAVRGYMGKYMRDCDNDENITCYDVARIHMAGPDGCNGTWVSKTDYWMKFIACHLNK